MISLPYKIGLGLALLFAAGVAFLWFLTDQQDKFFQAGKDSCVAVQATEQVKHDKEVRNTYDQIDRDTPSGLIDDRATIDFLLGHTRNTGK